ncbi:hypothetical protein SESBI_20477 [Sesbania bispinosa]|nr:hypothetical protein SESBI_20477 [Sesbania bispinosa]
MTTLLLSLFMAVTPCLSRYVPLLKCSRLLPSPCVIYKESIRVELSDFSGVYWIGINCMQGFELLIGYFPIGASTPLPSLFGEEHVVRYDDNEEETLDLSKEKVEWPQDSSSKKLKRLRRGFLALRKMVIEDDDEVKESRKEEDDDGDDKF